jgi:hypothetical protein
MMVCNRYQKMMDIHTLLPYRSPPAVAVIGDICLDLYYFTGEAGAEISVETGPQSYPVYISADNRDFFVSLYRSLAKRMAA